MSAQDLEQRARELLAAEYERSHCAGMADWVRAEAFDEMDVRHQVALDAIAAALRQQPAPVDLEQFREAVEFWGKSYQNHDPSIFSACAERERISSEADRLLSIIDNAGKVECAKPAPVDGESTGALTMGQRAVAFELLRCCESWEPNVCVLGNVRAKDAADLMRSILAHQPAPVVDDAMVERALNAKVRNWPVRQLFESECEARIAMRAALTVAFARAQGVQS